MRKNHFFAQVAACAAGLGMMLPSGTMCVAATPATQSTRQIGTDVVLTNGTLTGQYITSEGTPVDGAVVSIRRGTQEFAQATTDAKGIFTVNGLKSGVYEIATPGGLDIVRVWEAEAAPPAARQYATVVSSSAVRGQMFAGGLLPLAGIGAGVAGFTTGVVGITEANDAKRDARRTQRELNELRDELEQDQNDIRDQLEKLKELIDRLRSR